MTALAAKLLTVALATGITLAVASRVEPMALLAAPVAMAAITAGVGHGPEEDPRAGRSRLVHFGGAMVGALFAAGVPTLAWNRDSLAAAGAGLAGGVRLPRGRQVGQHLRGRRRGRHPPVHLDLVGTGLPWSGGVDPATVPSGAAAGLGLATWVALASWLFLGWRTVAVESEW